MNPRAESRIRWSGTADALLNNLSRTGRGRKQVVSVLADSAIAVACLWLAYSLRLGQPFSDFRSTWYLFALMPAVTVLGFSGFGIYRWVVRSSNARLFRQLAKGSAISALAYVLIVFLLPPDRANPRSLFVLYGVLLTLGTCSARLVWQALFDTDRRGEPLAVYGAGETGRRVVRMLSASSVHRPVLLIDDDRALDGTTVEGLPVVHGSREDLAQRLARFDVAKIVIAIDTLSGEAMQAKLAFFEALGLEVKAMPSVAELVSGEARPDEIRDVSIADILGRSEVLPDRVLMGRRVTGRRVLVTGGAGSIGTELARQILRLSPERLVVLDSSEAALYEITEELEGAAQPAGRPAGAFVPVLGSVKDRPMLDRVLAEHGVQTVFHAAAYKHVPIIERQPGQGVETNVFGTLNVVEAAIDAGVSDLVLISTDKAVRPTNAMGATKRVAEMVLQAKTREQGTTRLSMVRFGNVLGSSGSVVPKFKRQIRAGGPVTITHPDITRYFMTIPEAAQLVLQAGAIAEGGDVFVLDMGEPVKIIDLARSMVALYGKQLREVTGREGDVEIVVEGLRSGEKLYEELFLGDGCHGTEVAKIFTADEAWLPWAVLRGRLDALRGLVERDDARALRAELLALAAAGTRGDGVREEEAHPTAEREPRRAARAFEPTESRESLVASG